MNRRDFFYLGAGLSTAFSTTGSGRTNDTSENAYFKFSQDGKECLINRYDTPVPWLNLLGNDRIVAWTAHDGRIVESCLINNSNNRLTNPHSGYLYIRDAESGEYFLLNRPRQGSDWKAAQGLGYTRVGHALLGLSVSVTYFVPRQDDVLLWLISVRNTTGRLRTIDTFGVVEWCLGDVNYSSELPGGDFHSIYNNFKKVFLRDGILLADNYSWGTLGPFQGQKKWPYTAFFASSLPLKSFDCDKMTFLGRRGSLDDPTAVQRGLCAGQPAFGFTDFPLGVLQNSIRLTPHTEQQFVLMLGIVRDPGAARTVRDRYANPGAAGQALGEVARFWEDFTGKSQWIETPEKEIDRLVNIWIKYQHRASMLQNLNTGRLGFGIWCPAYPYGSGRMSDIRETGNVTCDLNLIREDLLDYLHGGPLLLESDLEPRWKEKQPEPFPFPYPHDGRGLWPYPVCWYVKETGDLSFLETQIEHRGRIPSAPKSGRLSLFDSMKYAVNWALSGLSERGLPRLVPGYGDWNDALNLVSRSGRGESVLTAMELCYMLRQCAEVAEACGRHEEARDWKAKYDRIKTAVNTLAWDGEWYIRAFTDEGNPVGSSKNSEGKIYLEVQAWAVLSGIADADRAGKCLQSVDRLLMTDYGPRICSPVYTRPAYDVGIVGDFGPGWRENGGIWNRTTGWTVMANCLAGRANEAFEMYRRASINNPSRDTDRFWLPPYAYPEYLVSTGPEFGRAQFQWCLGKAGTMWRAYTYYILGIRPQLDGLLVDPRIPNGWSGFKVTRPFRGAVYEIEVTNPKAVNAGARLMQIDDRTVTGNVIPALHDGRKHRVQVVLGG